MNATLAGTLIWSLDRAWRGANLCRDRLAQDNTSHDVDYYAWEAVRIMKIAGKVVSSGLRGSPAIVDALAALDMEAPGLKAFRDAVTHVEDNRGADDIVYFAQAVRLRPNGGVEYVVDSRYRTHDLLAEVVRATAVALKTLAPAPFDTMLDDP